MRVRIVSYEDVNAWILGKFARRLHEELLKIGVEADISNKPDPEADVNHHIIYLNYKIENSTSCDTLMITHIDDISKLNMLKKQLKIAKAGVCMSRSTMDELASAGILRDRLCFVNPAHDNVMNPRKLTVGITSKVQPDGCKREDLLLKLSSHISPADFIFTIMGEGWEMIVNKMRMDGFEVNYFNAFQYEKYVEIVPSFDYYLYMGQDEGSMGFIDALAAGVKTIVTPQGYHLDAENGITHPFNELPELVKIFKEIAKERNVTINSVNNWTWKDYAIKHKEIWEYLLSPTSGVQSFYPDGINSLLDHKIVREIDAVDYRSKIVRGFFKRKIYKIRKIKDYKTLKQKINSLFFEKRKS